MWERVRNLVMILLVTGLVWIYAEAESLSRLQQEVRITFVSATEELSPRVVTEEWRGVVRARFEGSAASLQRVPGRIELRLGSSGVPGVEGDAVIDIAQAMRSDPELQRAGVNVISVEPPTVRLRVDAIMRLDAVPVRAILEGIETEQTPRVEPAVVSIVGPRDALRQLASMEGGPVVSARIVPEQVDASRRGVSQRVRGPVGLPRDLASNGGSLRVSPPEVTVEFMLRRDTSTITVASAPVQVLLPPPEAGRWEVRIAPEDLFLRDIEVSGPTEFINQVRANEVRLVAVLALSSDDLERGLAQKNAALATLRDGVIALPPSGVRITVRNATVRFGVFREDGAPAAPGGAGGPGVSGGSGGSASRGGGVSSTVTPAD